MHQRTQRGQESPQLFIFLDDLLNLLGVTAVDDQLAQLASLGRGAGIHLIVGTQRLGEKGAAGSLVTGNMPTRLIFGTADAQDAALFTGRGGSGAEKLGRYPGDALLVTDGGTQRIAVGHITDAHLTSLRQQADSWRPWLARTSTARTSQSQPIRAVPVSTTRTSAVPVRPERGVNDVDGATETLLPQTGTTQGRQAHPPPGLSNQPDQGNAMAERKLPDRAPDDAARRYLRRLYEEMGSKNQVLLQAWGGVVNARGKTPKTKRWLDEALMEVVT
jgi:DNA segregation ATPase FtsK/SpoIIIE-like protein